MAMDANKHPLGFRAAAASTITLKTDLPPSRVNHHPSGVLHGKGGGKGQDDAFLWITNLLGVQTSLSLLHEKGYRDIVFVPYSSRENWRRRYAHAISTGLDGGAARDGGAAAAAGADDAPSQRKRKHKTRRKSKLRDDAGALLDDYERDELHLEIWNYFRWLHAKLMALEAETAPADGGAPARVTAPEGVTENYWEFDGEYPGQPRKVVASDEGGNKKPHGSAKNHGVDARELQGVVDKLETTFRIIPNARREQEAEGGTDIMVVLRQQQERRRQEEKQQEEAQQTKSSKKNPKGREESPPSKEPAPFLEEALADALEGLVAARERGGRPARRRWTRPRPVPTQRVHDFEDCLRKLAAYREEHGDCLVRSGHEDQDLAAWVKGLRAKRAVLRKRGVEGAEEVPPGKPVLSQTLTADRLARLDALEFVWDASPGHVRLTWEERFQEMMDYYETHGTWPTQSMGALGGWVKNQRRLYTLRDKTFMQDKFYKLDAVGFEWTQRGYVRMSWEEGFQLLLEFHRTHGHFDVPCPGGDKQSQAFRLYRWVSSLHAMYLSYRSGRRSGSLTEERIQLLLNHGFQFGVN